MASEPVAKTMLEWCPSNRKGCEPRRVEARQRREVTMESGLVTISRITAIVGGRTADPGVMPRV